MSIKAKGYILVLLSGILWSTTGLFANNMMVKGITSQQVAFTRLFLGFLFLFSYSIVKDRNLLKINKKIFLYCLLIGIISQAGFNIFYFDAVKRVGVSTAAVLLYTSPIFLAMLSRIIFKENLTPQKMISLLICFIGSILAVTGGKFSDLNLSTIGIIVGILSAITYACMSIISKKILGECKSITILIYGFLIGAILMIPISKPIEIVPYLNDMSVLPSILGIGAISAAGAYLCYVEGISKNIDLSIAGILASGELIGSVVVGWVLLNEEFYYIKLLGIVLMVISAVISVFDISIYNKLKNAISKKLKYSEKTDEVKPINNIE